MRKIIKFLFSRLGVSAIIVFFEFALVFLFMVKLYTYSGYFLALLLFNQISSLIAVIIGDENPEYKLTWMGVIVFVPFLGTVLYLLFGKSKMSKREIKRLAGVREKIKEHVLGQGIEDLKSRDALAAGKATAILGTDPVSEVFSNTCARYYTDGKDMFSDMLKDIEGAERYIFLEYFIIDRGVMWDEMLSRLRSKAEGGVDVRIMYDDMGCVNTLAANFKQELEKYGIKCVRFAKISADLRNMRRNNNRDHRKLCIVDGRAAYTGGINIADEYIGKKERFGVWKDGGVRLSGDAVAGTVRLFLELWMLAGGTRDSAEIYLEEKNPCQEDGGYYLPFGSGPYPMYKNQSGKRAILDIVNQAKRYVYIMTPYLIIDYDLTEALCGAVLRGVDVKIVTPGIPDKKIVKVMTKSSYHRLIEDGVEIYEYSPGFLHAKSIISDGQYGIVGTINMDYRSLVHHFEDAVWMYGSPVISDIHLDFSKTLSVSQRIDARTAELGFFEKIIRCGIRLFAPLF